MSPWFAWEPPFVIECHTREDVLFGMRRFRYVLEHYAGVHGPASVLHKTPQTVCDATGQQYPPLTDEEFTD